MLVLVADHLERERRGLARLLDQDPELTVVGEEAEAAGLVAQVQRLQPDLVLLHCGLPGLELNPLVQELRRFDCSLKVVVIGTVPDTYRSTLADGADACVNAGEPVQALLNTVRAVGRLSPCIV
jgi:DNA-binding NarL/FixJ family response regulator